MTREADQINELSHELRDLIDTLRDRNNNNSATISINAGGIGIWMCTVFASICMAVCIVGAMEIMALRHQITSATNDLSSRLDTNAAYVDRAQRTADQAIALAKEKHP
jgi:methyl-accepting chemotaxis protein